MKISLSGIVVNGNKIGRRLGFPTANIVIDNSLDIKNGVYTATVNLEDSAYDAIVNIGVKPTVSTSGQRVAEAHLLDFEGDLYGKTISITLDKFIRAEVAFSSLEQLRDQIEKDKQTAIEIIKNR